MALIKFLFTSEFQEGDSYFPRLEGLNRSFPFPGIC